MLREDPNRVHHREILHRAVYSRIARRLAGHLLTRNLGGLVEDPRRACTFLMSSSEGPKRNRMPASSFLKIELICSRQATVYAIESVFARNLLTAAESVMIA